MIERGFANAKRLAVRHARASLSIDMMENIIMLLLNKRSFESHSWAMLSVGSHSEMAVTIAELYETVHTDTLG